MEGEYWIYWNENDELPENVHIKSLLGIKHIEPARRFWYGDIFIVRFLEHPTTFAYDVHDAPTEVLQLHTLKILFQDMWQESFLESQLEEDRYFEERQQKIETDQDIIFQRMYVITLQMLHLHDFATTLTIGFRTPVEREILSRLPPNTLEWLAITGCDDGALLDTSVGKCPDDPKMMQINTVTRTTALQSIG